MTCPYSCYQSDTESATEWMDATLEETEPIITECVSAEEKDQDVVVTHGKSLSDIFMEEDDEKTNVSVFIVVDDCFKAPNKCTVVMWLIMMIMMCVSVHCVIFFVFLLYSHHQCKI